MNARSLELLLVEYEPAIVRIVRREGGGLLKHETVEDIVQGVFVRGLAAAEGFEFRGEPQFMIWLQEVVRSHVVTRYRYWKARKRDAGHLLRITSSDGTRSDSDSLNPAATVRTPSSFSALKEKLLIAAEAVSLLPPRDQQIIQCLTDEKGIPEIASDLSISYDAAQRARLRAIDRFQRMFKRLAEGPGSG